MVNSRLRFLPLFGVFICSIKVAGHVQRFPEVGLGAFKYPGGSVEKLAVDLVDLVVSML